MKKILIVDDEPDVIELVSSRLEANHYTVVTASDGEEGLHQIQADPPDLVILDIGMPVVNGYEVCSRIKRHEDYQHIPVIMLTAGMRYAHRKQSEHCGADGFISKPYCSERLLDEVRRFIG